MGRGDVGRGRWEGEEERGGRWGRGKGRGDEGEEEGEVYLHTKVPIL
jgi:hypothetical protein